MTYALLVGGAVKVCGVTQGGDVAKNPYRRVMTSRRYGLATVWPPGVWLPRVTHYLKVNPPGTDASPRRAVPAGLPGLPCPVLRGFPCSDPHPGRLRSGVSRYGPATG